MDDIGIGGVCHDFPVGIAVPLEVLVLTMEYDLSPSVEYGYFKILDLPLGVLRNKKVVIEAIEVCRRDGVGKIDIKITFRNEEGVGSDTVPFRSCYIVVPGVKCGDLGSGFASIPLEIRHFSLRKEVCGEVCTGIFCEHDNLKSVVDAV